MIYQLSFIRSHSTRSHSGYRGILCLIFLLILSLNSHAGRGSGRTIAGLLPLEEVGDLKKSEGYLLVDLLVSGIGPSFDFVKVMAKKDQRYVTNQNLRFGKQKWSISLKGKPQGLYALKLPYGVYQITQVKAPFFNLPYHMDTEKRGRWRFSIVKGEVSFIGRLLIDDKCGDEYVNIKLINRLAADYQRIVAGAVLLNDSPLRHAMAIRDDFSKALLEGKLFIDDQSINHP